MIDLPLVHDPAVLTRSLENRTCEELSDEERQVVRLVQVICDCEPDAHLPFGTRIGAAHGPSGYDGIPTGENALAAWR